MTRILLAAAAALLAAAWASSAADGGSPTALEPVIEGATLADVVALMEEERAAGSGTVWKYGFLALGTDDLPTARAMLPFVREEAEAGGREAQEMLGRLLVRLADGPEQVAEGLSWLERSAGSGNMRAAEALGRLLFFGAPDGHPRVASDRARGLDFLVAAAEAGEPDAAKAASRALAASNPGSREATVGRRLARRAADGRDPEAGVVLAWYLAKGVGGPADPARAREVLDAALPRLADGGGRYGRWAFETARILGTDLARAPSPD